MLSSSFIHLILLLFVRQKLSLLGESLKPKLTKGLHVGTLGEWEVGIWLKSPFSDRVEEFRKIGAEVIGASVDSEFTHLAWIKTPRKEGGLGKMNIPLVADMTKRKLVRFKYTIV